MKAIIVAAGRGRRLGPETAEIPKCMVAVGRPPDPAPAAGRAGRRRRRRRGDRARLPGRPDRAGGGARRLRFVENPDWANNNILASLLYAEHEMARRLPVLLLRHRLRDRARAPRGRVDAATSRWSSIAAGRTPTSAACSTRCPRPSWRGRGDAPTGRASAASASAWSPPSEAAGEFIGLAKLLGRGGGGAAPASGRGARAGGLDAAVRRRRRRCGRRTCRDALNADGRRAACRWSPVFIDGGWREIDTEEDLGRAHALVDGWG